MEHISLLSRGSVMVIDLPTAPPSGPTLHFNRYVIRLFFVLFMFCLRRLYRVGLSASRRAEPV